MMPPRSMARANLRLMAMAHDPATAGAMAGARSDDVQSPLRGPLVPAPRQFRWGPASYWTGGIPRGTPMPTVANAWTRQPVRLRDLSGLGFTPEQLRQTGIKLSLPIQNAGLMPVEDMRLQNVQQLEPVGQAGALSRLTSSPWFWSMAAAVGGLVVVWLVRR